MNQKFQKNEVNKLNPMWITGFIDAEGCFSIIIEIKTLFKWKVKSSFEINLHEKDKEILFRIKNFFDIGNVYIRSNKKIAVYRVTNINYLNNIIIPHFIKYPLISNKAADFLLWSKVVKMIFNKEHLNKSGFLKILTYYASINRGISNKVKNFYPNLLPYKRPKINLPEYLNSYWVSGFIAGDGGFSIYIKPAKDYLLGEKVYIKFHIAQHSKDLELMKLFIKFFNCGNVYIRSNKITPRCDFIVQDINSISKNIISHFDFYPLENLKQEDYFCFKKAIFLILFKKHLTKEGLNQIKNLNLEMNLNRLK